MRRPATALEGVTPWQYSLLALAQSPAAGVVGSRHAAVAAESVFDMKAGHAKSFESLETPDVADRFGNAATIGQRGVERWPDSPSGKPVSRSVVPAGLLARASIARGVVVDRMPRFKAGPHVQAVNAPDGTLPPDRSDPYRRSSSTPCWVGGHRPTSAKQCSQTNPVRVCRQRLNVKFAVRY